MNEDKRNEILERDLYSCQHCKKIPGYSNLQIAHRIGNNKRSMRYIENFLRDNYGKKLTKSFIQDNIIDNSLNVVTTCSLSCNDAQNIFFKPIARDELLKKIIEEVI